VFYCQLRKYFFELKRKVQSKLPPDTNVTGLEFEGPELVIYTDDPRKLADDGEIIRSWPRNSESALWSGRTEGAGRTRGCHNQDPRGSAKRSVLTDYYFDGETGEVVIEAEKPGLVIGRHGATLREKPR